MGGKLIIDPNEVKKTLREEGALELISGYERAPCLVDLPTNTFEIYEECVSEKRRIIMNNRGEMGFETTPEERISRKIMTDLNWDYDY